MATAGRLASPESVAVDSAGNVFFADQAYVFRLNAGTGVLIRVAGTGWQGFGGDGGPATSANLNNPHGLALDAEGSLYIADWRNHRIRKVTNGVITTVAENGAVAVCGDGRPRAEAKQYQPG